jgi:hypothetical protein
MAKFTKAAVLLETLNKLHFCHKIMTILLPLNHLSTSSVNCTVHLKCSFFFILYLAQKTRLHEINITWIPLSLCVHESDK